MPRANGKNGLSAGSCLLWAARPSTSVDSGLKNEVFTTTSISFSMLTADVRYRNPSVTGPVCDGQEVIPSHLASGPAVYTTHAKRLYAKVWAGVIFIECLDFVSNTCVLRKV